MNLLVSGARGMRFPFAFDIAAIRVCLSVDHGTPGWDDYRSPSPYSPGGSSLAGASEPDIPQGQ